MKKFFFLTILTLITTQSAWAQMANWSGYKPTKFPTNASGQIHGQARINQMKFHATNPNKMYAITPQGGLFITTDAATTWTVAPGTDALTAKLASVCIDYTNDQIIYLGGGDPNYWNKGAGAFKSTNGGATFSQLSGGLPTNRIVSEIIMHPTDPNTLVAATNGGIYKTTDAGATWVAKTVTSLQFCDMKSNTTANSLILYATTQTATPEFYRSTDFGDTWTLITTGLSNPTVEPLQTGSRVAVTTADPNVVYFAMVASGGILFKSTDGGLTFTQTKAGGSPYLTFYNDDIASSGQGNYNFCIGVDNADANKVWLQSHNTWYSNNSGSTWTMITFWADKVHTDMHQIGKSPYDNTKLYSCNDGGVWLSTDEGNNWIPKSDGIYAFEIGDNTGKSSPTRKDFISIGTQDNGRLYADSTGWYTIKGGDDYTKREVDSRTNSTATYYIGDPAGFSVSNVGTRLIAPGSGNTTYNLPSGVTIVEALNFNRTNTNLAFMGSSDIYRSTDVQNATPTWTQISTFSKTIMSIHSCIADPDRLYVLTSDQKIYVSTNALSATPTFTPYDLPTASHTIATVTAICNNANTVYISINNRVYRSADGGQTWTNITYNLPSVNHRRILSEAYYGTEELVFVATNNAVYYKKAGQTTWTNYSTNLPARQAPTELSIYDDGSNEAVIRYASYGRGIWETPFENLRTTNAVVKASSNNICSDATWNYADVSTGVIVSRVWSFPGGTPSSSTALNQSVTYASTGTYTATLTVTDANSNIATTTYQVMVNDLNKCDADTIPGNALQLLQNTDYATMSAPLNITTNTITFSAWIKPDGVQSSTTGLVNSGSNGGTGINLRSNNRLSYHWNNEAGSYSYNGPTIPSDVWSHIAVVITPSNATFYLNGVPSVRTATHIAVNFNSAFNIGNDRGFTTRTFKGLMDEVCIYNRSLSTNEIRELMHLTKVPTSDASLLAYYQMNEPNGTVLLNHAGGNHANLLAGATRATSTAPVGGGVSERQSVTTGGLKSFNTTGVTLEFPTTGIYPNGDVVVTRLNIAPDQKPTSAIVPNNGYFIVNNFGTNSSFSTLSSIRFSNLPGIATGYNTTDFGFYKRSSIADGNTWGAAIDQADVFTPNGQNSSLTFSTGNSINSFSQFVITPTYATAGADVAICNGNSTTLGSANNPALTYSWSPATDLSSTTISNPIASPTSNTTYTVTVTEIASGNTFTDEVLVSITAPFISAASITANPVSATVCAGGSVALTGSGGTAPTYIELGAGTSTTTGNSTGSVLGPNPLQNYYGGSKQLMLFTATELKNFGLIAGASLSGFGVNLANSSTYVLNNLQIKVQHTDLSVLSSFVTSGWTIVRDPTNYTPATGWNTIPFNTNFTWDGSSNLLVEVNYSNNNGGSAGVNTALYGTTSMVSTLFYRDDNKTAAVIDTYSGAPSYTYSTRNNVRFSIAGTTNYTWLPSTGLNTATGVNVTATPSTSTTYVLSASFAGSCPAKASQVVTVNPNPTLSLTPSCVSGPDTGVLTPTFTSGAGGTPTYNPSTLTGLSNGTYTVTVTEAPIGCTATADATINCVTTCPDLTAAAAAAVVSSESTCTGCALSGGVIAAPSTACPAGSTLQYSTDNGDNWSTTLPTYNQTTAVTVLTRCNCNTDTSISSPTGSVTTVPGVCTPVTAGITGTTTGCGSVTLTASGGTGYAWSDGNNPTSATNTFTTSGTYTVTVTGTNGCTATAIAVVTVTPNTSNTTNASACDSYTWVVNGTVYNASGIYTHIVGCHTETLNLTITANTSNTTNATACDSYTWVVNGTVYNASGIYTHIVGCHTETLNLTITDNTSNTTNATACDSYTWVVNGTVYNASGIYTHIVGCHTETLNLTITANTSNTTNATACGSYTWVVNGTVYNASGTYTHIVGCHTETLNLTITANTSNTTNATACGSYTWVVNGTVYNASGTYTHIVGCHTETLNLTITANTSNTTNATACGSYTWVVNGTVYNASGTYIHIVGCHTETLNLTITANTSNTTNATACGSYTWVVNGTVYNASGTYTHIVGCFTQTLNLTITPNTSNTTTASACGSYLWSVNGTTYTASGLYTSVSGCHTQILNLTITGPCPDCLGVPGGPAQPGTTCDDGNPNTTNDVYGNNCICAGTPPSTLCNIGATLNGNVNVCAGGVLGLIATGGNMYQWSGPNGYTSNSGGNISRTNANVNMSGTYTVTVTNNTCVDILSIVVTVHPIPSATLSGTTPVCSGGTITLTAPAGSTSYQWSGPGGFSTNTGNNNTLARTNATTLMGGLYKVTVTNAGGCTASASRSISVSAPTTATVTGATSVCGNANVVLTATTVGVGYAWTGPGGFTATTAAINTPAVAGQYKVTVSNAAGCISTASRTITVITPPTANITGNANICTGGNIYLIASGGGTYSWSGPGGYTKPSGSIVSRSSASVLMSGTYTVTVTGSGSCKATASIVVTVAPCGSKTSAGAISTESLTVYPNPTNGETTISFTTPIAEQITLSVYAVDGREVAVLFNDTTVADTTYELMLDMNPLPSGTYYAVLRHENDTIEQIIVMVVR